MGSQRIRRVAIGILVASAGWWLAGCGPSSPAPLREAVSTAELEALYEANDPFTLRDRLAARGELRRPIEQLYLAAVEHSFNRPERSNQLLAGIEEQDLPPELAFEARKLEIWNHFRLFDYAAAARTYEDLLASGLSPRLPKELEDLREEAPLYAALAGAPPQRVVERGDAVLSFEEGSGGKRVQVVVNGSPRALLVDTGANLSVLMHSEAESLGLEIRPTSLPVHTSTDTVVHADVAVSPSLVLGPYRFENVVFLVLPDEMLSFPEAGIRIPGILGLPVIEALGEIRFRSDSIEVRAASSGEHASNLALLQLHPLVRIDWQGDGVVCALDTGANRTAFYEPFHRRYRSTVDAMGTPHEVRIGGVGGVQSIQAVELPEVTFTLGGLEVTLEQVDVYVTPIANDDGSRECNLGQDALSEATS